MEALPITPAKASQQPAESPARHGFGDLFQVLLNEATLRLDSRPEVLPSLEIHRAAIDSERRFRPEPFAPTATANQDHASDSDQRIPSVGTETVREPAEPAARGDEDDSHGNAAVRATEEAPESPAADETDGTPRETDGDVQVSEDEPGEATPPAAPEQGSDAAPGTVATAGLPGPAQQVASGIAAGKAQALGAGEAAIQALARALAQPQLPSAAAPQAQLATAATPSATTAVGSNGAGVRVEVTPATLVAPPNAVLGGGAAVAALAAEAGQAAAQGTQANQPNGAAATAAASGQAAAANPVTATAAQLQNRPSTRPGQDGAVPGGPAHSSAGETAAQNAQGGDARVQSGPSAGTSTLVASSKPATGAHTLSQGAPNPNAPAQAATAQGTANPQNARTPFADALNTQAAPISNGQAAESGAQNGLAQNARAQGAQNGLAQNARAQGAQNGLAQNARAQGAQTQTARSLGAPVPGAETVGAPAERTTASVALPQAAQVQEPQPTMPAGTPAHAGAQSNASEQNGLLIGQATTGAAISAAAKAMERAGDLVPNQRAEGAGQTTAGPAGTGVFGLTQAAARISAMLPAQARPATASSVPLDQVAVHIQRAAAAGRDQIRIRLHPAELGQIEVKLKVASDGVVKAIVTVDRPETFDLLQRDARGLEKALQDAGLRTDSGSLSFNLRGDSQHRFLAGHEGAGNGLQDPDAETEPQVEPEIIIAANAANSDRILDIRV